MLGINDRHVIIQHIANIMSINIASVHSALTDILGMNKRIGNLPCVFEFCTIASVTFLACLNSLQ